LKLFYFFLEKSNQKGFAACHPLEFYGCAGFGVRSAMAAGHHLPKYVLGAALVLSLGGIASPAALLHNPALQTSTPKNSTVMPCMRNVWEWTLVLVGWGWFLRGRHLALISLVP
jgi:hypothetical protein